MKNSEYKNMLKIVNKITNHDQNAEDLMHDVLAQLQKNEKYNSLSEKDKLFFFIKSVQNQFYSNTSNYTRKYRKFSHLELEETLDVPDTIYEEQPTIDWIKETLELELQQNPDFWYRKGIFDLWIRHNGFVERVHKQTQIPRYEIKDVVVRMHTWLKDKWKNYNNEQSET